MHAPNLDCKYVPIAAAVVSMHARGRAGFCKRVPFKLALSWTGRCRSRFRLCSKRPVQRSMHADHAEDWITSGGSHMSTYNAQCSQIHNNYLSGCVKVTGSVRISSSKTFAWSNPKSLQSSLQSCEGDPVADVMVSACCHGLGFFAMALELH